MKFKLTILTTLCLAALATVGFRQTNTVSSKTSRENAGKAVSRRAAAFGLSEPVSSLSARGRDRKPESGTLIAEDRERKTGDQEKLEKRLSGSDDPLITAEFSGSTMPAPSVSFDGLSNADNVATYGLLIAPADMTGEVGPSHYVQIVNSLFRVYGKTGQPLTIPLPINSLFTNLGTTCSTRNDGLPNVLYDQLADRWIISQVCSAFPPFRQMIAVSKTGDPTGQWFAYEFVMPGVKLNDFPKIGVWPDGYYMTANEFLGADYTGTGIFAFEREKMLSGDPNASYVHVSFPAVIPVPGGMLPVDLDGLRPPPADTAAIIATHAADEYGEPMDAIRLFDFKPNFETPSATTFTERDESPIAVAPFDPSSLAGRADISQPSPGLQLDAVSDTLMSRLAYRNFGTHQSLVANQTVRTAAGTPYRGGVRLYEFRNSGSGYSPSFQSTIGDAVSSRWIGSAAQDNAGNLAVQYNFVSDVKKVSILYSGRLATDPPNTVRTEQTLIEGTGVQRAFGFRWGEYSGMSVDPVDDCTFWITNAYYTLESQTFSDLGWLTRVGAFKFPECTAAPGGEFVGTVTNAATGQPISGAVISANVYERRSANNGEYGPLRVSPGTYEIKASKAGFRTAAQTHMVSNGKTLFINFALEPIPVLISTGLDLTSESCNLNNAVEPGETVTVNISLRNTGAADVASLDARLLAGGGVITPGDAQNYGPMPAGGAPVSRPFTFTAAAGIGCGTPLNAQLRLSDGSNLIGIETINISTGEKRIAFEENFDGVTQPALPAGWTTSSMSNHPLWRTTEQRRESIPNSVFSPSSNQAGVNELVTPPFTVMTTDAELSFRNWYELETTFLRNRRFDGSVLEIKIGNGEWLDILAAGGIFLSGGYDGPLDTCCQNPLGGRNAWSGRSGVNQTSEFITTRVKLPPTVAGSTVRLRWRIGTDVGTPREGQYIDALEVTDGSECACLLNPSATIRTPYDFDGDGRTDLSVFNPSGGAGSTTFRVVTSSDSLVQTASWGLPGDIPTASDFDGDGKADYAVFRSATREWYVINSMSQTILVVPFGLPGDIPVAADYDNDGKEDMAVFRPSDGTWHKLLSTNNATIVRQFGLPGDVPVEGDYDGDRRIDLAVFRSSTREWHILRVSDKRASITNFGLSGDVPIAGDFDGDGKSDLAVFRPSNSTWHFLQTQNGFQSVSFGASGDVPLKGDFDGDGRMDVSVFRPSNRTWYRLETLTGNYRTRQFGSANDRPVPGTRTGS